jgi:hypothetical protein
MMVWSLRPPVEDIRDPDGVVTTVRPGTTPAVGPEQVCGPSGDGDGHPGPGERDRGIGDTSFSLC